MYLTFLFHLPRFKDHILPLADGAFLRGPAWHTVKTAGYLLVKSALT